jgi:hypothetical protein
MCKERVLDALDTMIAGFGRHDDQTAVCEAPNVQRKIEDLSGVQTGLDVLGVGRSRNRPPTGDRDVAVDSSQVTSDLRVEYSKHTASNAQNVQNLDVYLWRSAHGERVPRCICAGCRRSITPGAAVLDLADHNRVHLADGSGCLIARGTRWGPAVRARSLRNRRQERRSARDSIKGGPTTRARVRML